ncbi:MAG: hypothetical protein EBZ48_15815, partial [Proteobacteria bacterium]|nr:hypothetical protein [Pseudomonadota bacterium]
SVRSLLASLLLPGLLTACAAEPSYPEKLSRLPLPSTAEGMQADCTWIRSEIARMQTVGSMAQGQFALIAQAMARNNIAALESRAANEGCAAAFSSQPSQEPQRATLRECVDTCRANTTKSGDQCFEACNK